MAGTRICSIVGRKNAGKTTLAVALAAEFHRRGRRVMTIKHATHAAQMDTPGTDSYRHFHEGKAERVVLACPEERYVLERSKDEMDPVALAKRYLDGADIVLVEGFKAAPLPKVEVWRKAIAAPPLVLEPGAEVDRWVALITDDKSVEAPCRMLSTLDTMWMHILAELVWDRAKVIAT
ncbi:MAG TPA: molybdopterin-guanine dinucleotide biosynthesis protein B [Gemmatimonadales bacterium]|nr:molybdopterin-guanine dinucleotide biosynthesis protein B [Gemmatimonadales bacterium]